MAEEAQSERLVVWQNRWQTRNIRFHRDHVNSALMENIDKLTAGRSGMQILLPLCGKTLDLAWLYQLGHYVIGVEGVEQAILEFFEEQKLEFVVEKVDSIDGKCYRTLNERLKIYHCDFFHFTSSVTGQMDCVFDRGSLVAIDRKDRQKYAEVMKPLLKPGFRYLLQTVEYDVEGIPEDVTPKCVPMQEVNELFGDFCLIEVIDTISNVGLCTFGYGDVVANRINILLSDKAAVA